MFLKLKLNLTFYINCQSPRDDNTAEEIWEFQRNLAAILMLLMGTTEDNNPIFLVQFDQDDAK